MLLIGEKLFEIISQQYYLRRGYLKKSETKNSCEYDRINTILYTNKIYINKYTTNIVWSKIYLYRISNVITYG